MNKRNKRGRQTEDAILKLYWRWHEGDETDATCVRVWRSDWSGDQFEIIERKNFATLRYWMGRFSLPMLKASDD